MKKLSIAIALSLLTASFAVAQDLPKPDPKSKELQWFVGSWQCTGKSWGMGKELPTKANVVVAWTLNGFWLQTKYVETKTEKNVYPIAATLLWSYDAGQKQFVSGSVDNTGGYSTEASDGWKGDTLTWSGAGHGMMPGNVRETFLKKSANELVHTGETETKGAWMKTDEERCKRARK